MSTVVVENVGRCRSRKTVVEANRKAASPRVLTVHTPISPAVTDTPGGAHENRVKACRLRYVQEKDRCIASVVGDSKFVAGTLEDDINDVSGPERRNSPLRQC